MTPSTPKHLAYIDCLRGYAILMVITSHAAYLFSELPYDLHRIAVAGWFGVQLFFLASCITLLQSWHRELRRSGKVSLGDFFMRRFFRIAPAYYLAAILYSVIQPSAGSYTVESVLRSVFFINALSPAWAHGTYSIVPGGWSIGVEFAFYAMFPLFAWLVTSLKRAVIAFGLSLVIGWVANGIALATLASTIPSDTLSQGLFFWFPNELSVFGLGGIAYFLLQRRSALTPRLGGALVAGATLLFAALTFVRQGHFIGDSPLLPDSILVSAVFVVAIIGLSAGPRLFVNPAMALMGRVSFSAYLLHFAVIQIVSTQLGGLVQATGYAAVAAFAFSWPVIVLLTFGVAWVSFRFVELPMIALGKRLVSRPQAHRIVAAE